MPIKRVFLDKEIDVGSASNLRSQLSNLNGYDTIEVWINCYGGIIGEAINMLTFLKQLRSEGIKVNTIASGFCDSSAVIVFLAGEQRLIDKFNESFLIHQPTNSIFNANPESARAFADDLENSRANIANIYCENAPIDYDTAITLIKAEKSLTPTQTIQNGFATGYYENKIAKNLFHSTFGNKNFLARNSSNDLDKFRDKFETQNLNMVYQDYMSECLGKLRIEMPQIDAEWQDTFVEYFRAKYGDENIIEARIDLCKLKPSQIEFDLQKVYSKWFDKSYESRVFIISQDFYLLDGHHDWAGGLQENKNYKAKTISINIPIEQLIKEANELKITRTENKKQNKPMNFDYQAVNTKGNALTWTSATLAGKTKASYLSEKAKNMLAEHVKQTGAMPLHKIVKASNMSASLEDGTLLFIYTEDDILVGKRIVLADADGYPTDVPAPNGLHTLTDGMVIEVMEGIIMSAVAKVENAMPIAPVMPAENMIEEVPILEVEVPLPTFTQEQLDAVIAQVTAKLTQPAMPVLDIAQNKAKNMTDKEAELQKQIAEMQEALRAVQTKTENFSTAQAQIQDSPRKPAVNSAFTENPKSQIKEGSVAHAQMQKAKNINQRHLRKNANDIAFVGNDYAGIAQLEVLTRALLSGNTVERGLFTVIQDVKDVISLTKVDTNIELQDPSAIFTPDGQDITIDFSRKLELVKYEVHKQTDWDDLRTSFLNVDLQAGSLEDYQGSQRILNWWVSNVVEQTKNANDSLYWVGKAKTPQATFTAPYNGLINKAIADAGVTAKFAPANLAITNLTISTTPVLTVASTTNLREGDFVTFKGVVFSTPPTNADLLNTKAYQIQEILSATTFSIAGADTTGGVVGAYTNAKIFYINQSNVIQYLYSTLLRVNEAVRGNDDLKIFVPYHLRDAYKAANASVATSNGTYWRGAIDLDFLGERMEVINYLPQNTIWMNSISNQFLGVDLLLDRERVKAFAPGENSMDLVAQMRISMKSDVTYGYANELAMCTALL